MDSLSWMLPVAMVMALGLAWFLYMEYQARTLRTRVLDVPGGLRFESHWFSIEVQREAMQLLVRTQIGQRINTPAGGGEAKTQVAPLEVGLPASGLQITVARPMSGVCTITVSATDGTIVSIDPVPEVVAVSFNSFAYRVRTWVEKLDKRLAQERVERLRQEEAAAQAAEQEQLLAEARAGKSPDDELTDNDRQAMGTAQIAKWRKTAGFTGNASEVSLDDEGRVAWFVDLANDGRITLHANKRTIHTTLLGAEISSLGGELEISVRDDYWSEDDPALRTFRVFKGLPPDERRAWKERLEMVRDSIKK